MLSKTSSIEKPDLQLLKLDKRPNGRKCFCFQIPLRIDRLLDSLLVEEVVVDVILSFHENDVRDNSIEYLCECWGRISIDLFVDEAVELKRVFQTKDFRFNVKCRISNGIYLENTPSIDPFDNRSF